MRSRVRRLYECSQARPVRRRARLGFGLSGPGLSSKGGAPSAERIMGMNAIYRGPQDCPDVIPVFPLPGALLLPRGQMPLNIFEPRYLIMVDDALKTNRLI